MKPCEAYEITYFQNGVMPSDWEDLWFLVEPLEKESLINEMAGEKFFLAIKEGMMYTVNDDRYEEQVVRMVKKPSSIKVPDGIYLPFRRDNTIILCKADYDYPFHKVEAYKKIKFTEGFTAEAFEMKEALFENGIVVSKKIFERCSSYHDMREALEKWQVYYNASKKILCFIDAQTKRKRIYTKNTRMPKRQIKKLTNLNNVNKFL